MSDTPSSGLRTGLYQSPADPAATHKSPTIVQKSLIVIILPQTHFDLEGSPSATARPFRGFLVGNQSDGLQFHCRGVHIPFNFDE